MTNELLPCPFCGQEVAIAEEYDEDKLYEYVIDHCCHSWGAYTKIYMSSHGVTEQSKQDLVETWNARASLTDECSGCVHCHKGADWEICQSCARNWHDKYEVAQ